MTLPISGGADRAWAAIMVSAKTLDGSVRSLIELLPTGILAGNLRQAYDLFCGQMVMLQNAVKIPGLNAYAQLVMADPSYDAVTAVTVTAKELQQTIDSMRKAWPSDADRAFLFHSPDTGRSEDLTFSQVEFPDLGARLQALLETLG